MNERIRELLVKSGAWEYYEINEGVDGDEKPMEKFAELIVRECIECARGAGLADDVAVRNGLGFNDGISEAVTHMKKHFGVER